MATKSIFGYTSPRISSIINNGTLTLPNGPDTLIGRTSTDTLTNKTLTSPILTNAALLNNIIVDSGNTITFPMNTTTLVGTNTTDTLTNKIINSTTQPAFYSYLTSDVSNITGDGTSYVCICDTATINVGSCYNTSNGTFTAPATGKWLFTYNVALTNVAALHTVGFAELFANGIRIIGGTLSPGACRASTNDFSFLQQSVILNLTSGNTVTMRVAVNGSTKTITLAGYSGGAVIRTLFSACLLP